MSKEEFLHGLEAALSGEVPAAMIRENISYYDSYISQEMSSGRTVDEIVAEIGEPRIVARTIIDSAEAAGEATGGAEYEGFEERSYGESYEKQPTGYSNIHYFDLNKWYVKALLAVVAILVGSVVFSILGGIFALLMRFAGPIMMILLVLWVVRNFRS